MSRMAPISDGRLDPAAVRVRIPEMASHRGQASAPESGAKRKRALKSPLADSEALRRSQTKRVRSNQSILEQQLAETQKLACMARAMAGVAHDLRNVLTGITLLAEVLAGRTAGTPDATYAAELTRSAHCAQELLQQVLSVARPAEREIQALSLHTLVAEMSGLLQQVAGPAVSVDLRRGEGVPEVRIAPAQVHQVLLNLVFNARDAMPSGGTLTIETWPAKLARTEARHWGIRAGNYAKLVVRDTGCGMDAVTRARACDPFFTTKPETGTGLGLAMVRRIVKENRGALGIESRPGKGTAIILLLPESGANSAATGQRSSSVKRPYRVPAVEIS